MACRASAKNLSRTRTMHNAQPNACSPNSFLILRPRNEGSMAEIASANPLANLRLELRGGRLVGTRVVADSMDLGWRGIQAAITQHSPLRETVRGICEPSLICLIYHLAGPTMLTRKLDGGPLDRGVVLPRQMCLTPAGPTAYWNHSD